MEKCLTKEIKKLLRYSGAKLEKTSHTKDGLFFETKFFGRKYKVFVAAA